MKKHITIAAPMYNEQNIIQEFIDELASATDDLDYDFKVLLVNDGSTDASMECALACDTSLPVRVINLSRNFGHPTATRVCLENAQGDAVILMDSDLQDDPAAIGKFLEKFEDGYDVVYAVRTARESLFKKIIFSSFYKLINLLANIDLPLDSGNYSLISRRVINHINEIPSGNRYLPGLRAFMGFKQTPVPVARRKRHGTKSRVGLRGLFKLAFDGIFSFSYIPIRVFHAAGMLSIILAVGLSLWALGAKLFSDSIVIAWASQLIALSFFSGVIILGISVVGEYVARVYEEIKQFPKYIIADEFTNTPIGERDETRRF